MNSAPKDELLIALSELRVVFPDWRSGQTLSDLAMAAAPDGDVGPWNVEDDPLLEAAPRLIDRNRMREAVSTT